MKFKRLSMTLMLLVAMMTAVGCVSSSDGQPRGKSTESKAEEGLLTMSWNKDIGPLNPHLYGVRVACELRRERQDRAKSSEIMGDFRGRQDLHLSSSTRRIVL